MQAKESSIAAPVRHPVPWQEDGFYNEELLDAELRRVFDICHGCRRCFNLCDSFPRLFDLIDESTTGELDSVSSTDFKPVVDACTLCDLCFLTKCPYVPPHEFNLDFPHLMLRYRAGQHKKGKTRIIAKELTKTDRNGKLGCSCSGLANWATSTNNSLTRKMLEKVAGVDKQAYLPPYSKRPLTSAAASQEQKGEPGIVLYATCFANYNNTAIGEAALEVLARNQVTTELVYPQCCGMPQLEHGDIASVVARAASIAATMEPWIDKGYEVVSLTPSCSLMLKFEWPLLVPQQADEFAKVQKLANATKDISEYLVGLAQKSGLTAGMQPLEGGVTAHIACHARAQNIGQKAAALLRLLPDTKVDIIERCSGHGGSWGIMKENFAIALKVGKPVARTANKQANKYLVSECPLAREHIVQGMQLLAKDTEANAYQHPVELIALAYRLGDETSKQENQTHISTD